MGLRPYIGSEMENRESRAGEGWLDDYEILEAVNKKWEPTELCTNPVCGFFDTSDVIDLSSIFFLEDVTSKIDPENSNRFEYVTIPEYVVWDPKDSSCIVVEDGHIKEALVEKQIIEILKNYPTLMYLGVDTRWRPWAQSLVAKLRRTQEWGT